MKRKINLLIVLILTVFGGMQAQTYTDDEVSDQQQQVLLQNQRNTPEARATSANDNNVFIDQLGANNNLQINTTVDNSSFLIAQVGDNNIIDLQLRVDLVNQQIQQRGNNHLVSDFSTNTRLHNLTIVQDGANQNFVFHGGNSISEDMKITMQGQNQSIIVRSFN